ncbi:MAG: IS110 family transposase [Actinomycetota bacterium]|nr:IS110 family transposase [Actinomycetota bacterium]
MRPLARRGGRRALRRAGRRDAAPGAPPKRPGADPTPTGLRARARRAPPGSSGPRARPAHPGSALGVAHEADRGLRHRPRPGSKIIGRVANVARFPTKAHFASYTGTAPIEVSSAGVVHHRLSRGDDRQLNYALHMVAICQITRDTEGQAYYRRKLAEGKSKREALRSLKRRISDTVFKKLLADLDGAVLAGT